mmetsp:Transcript_48528/g.110185  ORF Transcript_48528/g.110185 Transcript_48528/m.110185 type:complete len:669 (-) Transcript_48528:77-2083(-)
MGDGVLPRMRVSILDSHNIAGDADSLRSIIRAGIGEYTCDRLLKTTGVELMNVPVSANVSVQVANFRTLQVVWMCSVPLQSILESLWRGEPFDRWVGLIAPNNPLATQPAELVFGNLLESGASGMNPTLRLRLELLHDESMQRVQEDPAEVRQRNIDIGIMHFERIMAIASQNPAGLQQMVTGGSMVRPGGPIVQRLFSSQYPNGLVLSTRSPGRVELTLKAESPDGPRRAPTASEEGAKRPLAPFRGIKRADDKEMAGPASDWSGSSGPRQAWTDLPRSPAASDPNKVAGLEAKLAELRMQQTTAERRNKELQQSLQQMQADFEQEKQQLRSQLADAERLAYQRQIEAASWEKQVKEKIQAIQESDRALKVLERERSEAEKGWQKGRDAQGQESSRLLAKIASSVKQVADLQRELKVVEEAKIAALEACAAASSTLRSAGPAFDGLRAALSLQCAALPSAPAASPTADVTSVASAAVTVVQDASAAVKKKPDDGSNGTSGATIPAARVEELIRLLAGRSNGTRGDDQVGALTTALKGTDALEPVVKQMFPLRLLSSIGFGERRDDPPRLQDVMSADRGSANITCYTPVKTDPIDCLLAAHLLRLGVESPNLVRVESGLYRYGPQQLLLRCYIDKGKVMVICGDEAPRALSSFLVHRKPEKMPGGDDA